MFLNTEKEIKEWLDLMKIKNYTIVNLDEQLVVDVDDVVSLTELGLTEIPIKFNNVTGDFDLWKNNLENLKGCPEKVGKDFVCSNNQLTSLEHCPKEVGENFYCSTNKLESLKGCPKKINMSFRCENNLLKSLEHCPEKVGGVFCCTKNQLETLKFAPEKIGEIFWCQNNKIIEIDNPLWVEHFKQSNYLIEKNQLLDTNFLDIKYKKLFDKMKYDLRTLKKYKKEFKQFLDSGLIMVENINLDLWSSDVS
jgi:hypothetical protein